MTQLNILAAVPVKSEGRASPGRSKLPDPLPSCQFGNCLKKLVQKTSPTKEPAGGNRNNGNQTVSSISGGKDRDYNAAQAPVIKEEEKSSPQAELQVERQSGEPVPDNDPELQDQDLQAASDIPALSSDPALIPGQNQDVAQLEEGIADSLTTASSPVLIVNAVSAGLDGLQKNADEAQIPAPENSGAHPGEEIQPAGKAAEQLEPSKPTGGQVPIPVAGSTENTGVPWTAGDVLKADSPPAIQAVNPENTGIPIEQIANNQSETVAENKTERGTALPADKLPKTDRQARDESVKPANTQVRQNTSLIKDAVTADPVPRAENAAEPEPLSNSAGHQEAEMVAKGSPETTAPGQPAEGGRKVSTTETVVMQPEALKLYLASQKREKSITNPTQAVKPESPAADQGETKVRTAVPQEVSPNPEKAAFNLKKLPALEVRSGSAAVHEDGKATDVKKLIEFESKRLSGQKTGTGQVKNELPVSTKTAESSENVQWLGKTGLESLKNQVGSLLNVPDHTSNYADPEEVVEQVVKKAELMLKLNSSEMKIQLHPEFLGKMTIKILAEDGAITARFITDSHQVKHLLDSNLNTLRQSLESQGIRVEKTEVNVQLNNGGMFDGSEGSRQDSWQQQQQRFTPSYRQAGDLTDGYQPMAEDDDSVWLPAENENYGIARDGSMNFVV